MVSFSCPTVLVSLLIARVSCMASTTCWLGLLADTSTLGFLIGLGGRVGKVSFRMVAFGVLVALDESHWSQIGQGKSCTLPFMTNNLLQEEWQQEWESESNVNNKLKRILPKLNENHTPKGMTRRDGSIMCKATHRPLVFDSLLSLKRRTPAFLRQLQWITDKLCWVCWH